MKHRWRQLLLLLQVVLFLCLAASAESPAEQFPYEETIWAHFDEWFAGISPEDKAKFHIVSADSFHNADYGTMTEVCLQYSEISNINLSILFTEEGEPILLWPNDYHAKALAVLHEQPISEEMAWAFFRSYYDQFAADPGIASAAYEAYLAD